MTTGPVTSNGKSLGEISRAEMEHPTQCFVFAQIWACKSLSSKVSVCGSSGKREKWRTARGTEQRERPVPVTAGSPTVP